MVHLTFEIDGVVEMSRNLQVLINNIPKLDIFFARVEDMIDFRIDEIFRSEGSALKNHPVWRPLAPSTQKARKNRTGYYRRPPKGTPKILRWTGNLQDKRHRRHGKDFVEVALLADYAVYHFRGGGDLPMRRPLELDQGTITEIERALQTHIDRTIGISGLQV